MVSAGAGQDASHTAPWNESDELLMATIGVALTSPERSVQPEEHARFLDALAVLNEAFGDHGVTLIELQDRAAVEVVLNVALASTSPCGDVSDGVLGCTAGGGITVLDGWNWHWGEDATRIDHQQFDFQTVVTHELGHAIGLDHSGDPDSVMYFALAPGVTRRGLTENDLAAMRPLEADLEALMARELFSAAARRPRVAQDVPLFLDDRRHYTSQHDEDRRFQILERPANEDWTMDAKREHENPHPSANHDLFDRFFALASDDPMSFLKEPCSGEDDGYEFGFERMKI
jgi:hypothetical protein